MSETYAAGGVTAAMRARNVLDEIDRLERSYGPVEPLLRVQRMAAISVRAAKERRRALADSLGGCDGGVELVALMADDANEKVRRVRVADPIERAFRAGQVSDDEYRVARCLEADFRTLWPSGGAMRLDRVDGGGMRRTRAQDHALQHLHDAARARGVAWRWALIQAWAGEGRALYELDGAWRRARGWAGRAIGDALAAIDRAHVYELRKAEVIVWAEAG